MLTKDLIRYFYRKDKVFPGFLDVLSPPLLQLAEELINCFKKAVNKQTAKSLQEELTPLIHSQKDMLLTKGLVKLLMDRSKFSTDSDVDYLQIRKQIFTYSNSLIKKHADLNIFQREMRNKINLDLGESRENFYEDLTEYSLLKEFKEVAGQELLHIYNISLVQSLLIYCRQIEIAVEDDDTSKYRNLFRSLKFHQLLGTPFQKENQFKLIIDGPLSVLENSKKYGLKIAFFFPHITEMKKWSLHTQIHLKKKPGFLSINESSGLKNPYRKTHFIPEELNLFREKFNEHSSSWTLTPFSKWVHFKKQYFILPDFTIENQHKKQYHIELFHRWHSSKLLERIELLEKEKASEFIIGVDRSLTKKPGVKKALHSTWFEKYGFLFTEIPVPGQVFKLLDKLYEDRLF